MWADVKDWQNTYFRLSGRFNRARYWLHSVLALAVAFILELFVIFMFPIPDTLIAIFHSDTLMKGIQAIVGIAPAVTFIYISTAISVKRLHDRDKSGWWALFYLGLPSLVFAAMFLATEATGKLEGWPAALMIPYLIMLIVTFIELACLKGTAGPNQFGTDRLAAHPAAAHLTTAPRPGG